MVRRQMLTTIGAYLLIVLFLIIERHLRQGREAISLETGQYDQGSTRYIGHAFALTFAAIF